MVVDVCTNLYSTRWRTSPTIAVLWGRGQFAHAPTQRTVPESSNGALHDPGNHHS